MVFTAFLLLAGVALCFPEMAPQALLGILWTGAGALMLARPPEHRIPRSWVLLATGFVTLSLAGFLPQSLLPLSPWRSDLHELGLDTGRHLFVQPGQSAEVLAGFAVTAAVALFLLGHRVPTTGLLRLALGFALGVGTWAAVAMLRHEPGTLFGCFPNRNHTATLLAMGSLAGLGCFAQAIRSKNGWVIALSLGPTCLLMWALFGVSESRAGIVLFAAGLLGWITLTGLRYFGGNTGKALVLILLTVGGVFLIADSTAKKRLTDTIDKLAPSEIGQPPATTSPFSNQTTAPADPPLDARIPIYRDTLAMIRSEPWTGVGPGQFVNVFPQYRAKTISPNHAQCLHPESSWLKMLAETGWPATLCLAAGVVLVAITSLRRARKGRARFLRIGCIVAALLLCLHCIFDVPGHRIGLAWAAALLLAMALRAPGESSRQPSATPSRPARLAWRGIGLLILTAGGILLIAQARQTALLPSARALRHMQQAKALYDADQAAYEEATAAGLEYQPPPERDPLEAALPQVAQTIRVTPLDPHPHYVRGVLALHYDNKHEIAREAFAIQRRLIPTRVNLLLEQARAWMIQSPQRRIDLWQEAMHRATTEATRRTDDRTIISSTYQRILRDAGREDESIAAATLALADGHPELLPLWARNAPTSLLDRELPRLIPSPMETRDRQALFKTWQQRGSRESATEFARSHPDLDLDLQTTPPNPQ